MDAVALPRLPRDLPAIRLSRSGARGRLAVSRRPLELPPEAVELVEQVRSLEADARRLTTQLQSDLVGIRKAAADERAEVARESAVLAQDREALEVLLESRVRGFGFIGDAWADYERARANGLAASLQYKKHPAKSAAKAVRAQGKEFADLRRELKRTQWVLALYELIAPTNHRATLAGPRLLEHAAALRELVAHRTDALVTVDVDPASLERAADAWNLPH